MKMHHIFQKLSDRTAGILGEEEFFRFSVLLPLFEKNGETHILFEIRADHLRRQPGEVCFPGGKIDPEDVNPLEGAIRETTEELGIEKNQISHVLPLDYMVSAFGTIIYPFAGMIPSPEHLKPNEAEVGEVFAVPISHFLTNQPARYKINYQVQPEEGFPFDLIVGGENYNWQSRDMEELFYHFEGKVIWGLTARILSHFLDLINKK